MKTNTVSLGQTGVTNPPMSYFKFTGPGDIVRIAHLTGVRLRGLKAGHGTLLKHIMSRIIGHDWYISLRPLCRPIPNHVDGRAGCIHRVYLRIRTGLLNYTRRTSIR